MTHPCLKERRSKRMATSLYSIEEFQRLVRSLIKESIHEEMVTELDRLNLKELGGVEGTQGSQSSQTSTGTSGTTGTMGAKGTMSAQSGNNDPANNVMVPGTNMSVNQGLQAAAKEQNFKKKADLINKISGQLSGMKGVVVKEEGEEPVEPWRILNRALINSQKAAMKGFNDGLDMLIAKGMKPAEAAKMYRAMENVLSNIQQSLQMNKDVEATKARAMKAAAKSPLLKKYLPVELGGELQGGGEMAEGMDEPEMVGKKKVNTRDPMFPDLIRRIANLVYYGDKSDEEVLADLGDAVDGVNVTDRWVRFMANMVRKGKDVMEESKKGDRDDKVGPRDDRKDWSSHGKRLVKKRDAKTDEKEMKDAKRLSK
jgi:hypothetical protein